MEYEVLPSFGYEQEEKDQVEVNEGEEEAKKDEGQWKKMEDNK